jgi:ubiquinone/menaquinone biosynthesis C-methylase UbiE
MSIDDRERWNERHLRRIGLTPRPSVLQLPPAATGQVALDVACGQGRHVLALAQRGYDVVAMDISTVALSHVRRAVEEDRTRLAF